MAEMKRRIYHVSVNGFDLTPFVNDVKLNEFDADRTDTTIPGLKPTGPITLEVDFAENRCGNCGEPFSADPAAGVPYVTEPEQMRGMKLCPPCYVALTKPSKSLS